MLREVLELWAESRDVKSYNAEGRDEELLREALEEIEDILGPDGRKDSGWTREEMIQASGMSAEDFTSTYLDFLESESENLVLSS